MKNEIVIQTFINRYEAETALALLKENGIYARLSATDVAGVQPLLPLSGEGIQLFIHKADQDQARELLGMISQKDDHLFSENHVSYDTKYRRRKKFIRYTVMMGLLFTLILPLFFVVVPLVIDQSAESTKTAYSCSKVSGNPEMDEVCIKSYVNGVRYSIMRFKDGAPHGLYTEYYFNGQVAMKFDFEYGDIPGEVQEFDFDDGSLRTRFMLKNYKLHGAAIQYYPSGQMRFMAHYDEGDLDGDVIYFDPDGSELRRLSCEHNRCQDASGHYLNGEVVIKYKNGQIYERATYEDGYAEGKVVSYYANGFIESTGMAKKGRAHGKACHHARSGLKLACYDYVDDEVVYQEMYDYTGQVIYTEDNRS